MATWGELKELAEETAREHRDFTRAEQDHWERLVMKLDDLDRRMAALHQLRRVGESVFVVRKLTAADLLGELSSLP